MRSGSRPTTLILMKLKLQQQFLNHHQSGTLMNKMLLQSCRACCPRQMPKMVRKNEVLFAKSAKLSSILAEKTYMLIKRSVIVTTAASAYLTSITIASFSMDASAKLICASSPVSSADSSQHSFSLSLLQQHRVAKQHRDSLLRGS